MDPAERNREELIEDYLLGRLDGEAAAAFEARLAADEALQQEVAFQKLLMESIRLDRKTQLKSRLRKNLKQEAPRPHLRTVWWSAAAMLLLVLGVSFFMLLKDNKLRQPALMSEQAEKPAPEMDTAGGLVESAHPDTTIALLSDKTPAPKLKRKTQSVPNVQADVQEEKETADEMALQEATPPAETKAVQSTKKSEAEGSTLNGFSLRSIKEDRLLKDSMLNIMLLATAAEEKNQDVFLNKKGDKTERQKLEKISSTVADSVKAAENTFKSGKTLHTEYWQSAINFKGYKYFRDKLQLYGIGPGDKVKLITWEKNLYLLQGKKLYKLAEQNEYNSFVAVTDPDILKAFGL